MNPGATTSPEASNSDAAEPAGTAPTAAMRPPLIATSPAIAGAPVPSTIRPFRMTRLYNGGHAACGGGGVVGGGVGWQPMMVRINRVERRRATMSPMIPRQGGL